MKCFCNGIDREVILNGGKCAACDLEAEKARAPRERFRSQCEIVLDAIPEEDRGIVGLNVNRFVNMVGGRASDAARSEVTTYQRIGAAAYRAKFEADRKSVHGTRFQ